MQVDQKRKRRFFAELIMVCLLIFSGIILIGRTIGEYGRIFLDKQDEQLVHLAKLVDKNIENLVGHCMVNLEYVTERRGFAEAEDTWLRTGEADDLLYRMGENLVTNDALIAGILAIRDDRICLSTDGSTDYRFIEGIGTKNLQPCEGRDGTIYLALFTKSKGGVTYAALMNLDVFYRQIAGEELEKYDWIILTDKFSDILMYNQQGHLEVEGTDAMTGATCGNEGVELLLSQQKKQISATFSYEYLDASTKEEYAARMVVLPTNETQNQAFAVGVVTNFETILVPLRNAAVFLIICGGMVIAGVLLLVIFIMRFRNINEKDLVELQIMREKGEKMERLVQKTNEAAHHQRWRQLAH